MKSTRRTPTSRLKLTVLADGMLADGMLAEGMLPDGAAAFKSARTARSGPAGLASATMPSARTVRSWIKEALLPAVRHAEITVRFTDATESRRLNRRFRGKDKPTNVLSFPYSPAPALAGDLLLCVPKILAEAKRQGKTAQAHFAHLVVHGMLHLQGYDHENSVDAARMERKERKILSDLGLPDPY